jgi:hypothetical protein
MLRNWSLPNWSPPSGKALLLVLGLVPLSVPMFGMPLGGIPELGVTFPAHAQTPQPIVSADPIVTSDTPEYCGVLRDRISGITRATALPPPTAAAELSEEGERMCVHGQTRAGILRLRRALEILRNGED